MRSSRSIPEYRDSVNNEVLGITHGAAKLRGDYVTAFHAMKRRNKPGFLVRFGTPQQIDEFDVHGRYARDNRSSSILTDSG